MSNIKKFKENDFEFYLKIDDAPNPNDEEYMVHIHDVYELYCFISGDAEYVVEGNVYPLMPNSILLMRPGELHHIKIKSSLPYKRFVVWLSPKYFENVDFVNSLLMPYNDRDLGKRNLYTEDMFEFIKPSDCLKHIANTDFPRTHEIAFCKSYLNMALENILEAFLTVIPISGSNLRIENVIKYINEHLCDTILIDDLCKCAELSKAQLNRVFKKETNMTIGQHISAKRMFLAKTMLNQGMQSAKVCSMCGYTDYSAFYRMYKKTFGVTPSVR